MAMGTIKTGISLPKDEYQLLEKLRKKMGITRSQLFHRALSYWLKTMEEEEKVRKYIEGYRRKPESIQEIRAIEKAAAEAFQEED